MSWKKEIGRKAIHLSWGLVLLGYIKLQEAHGRAALWLPFSLLMLFLAIDFARIQYKFRLPLFGQLLRDKESKNLFTPTTTMMGMTLALAVYDLRIASAAIMMMVLGDVAANIAGRTLGRTKIGDKTLEGTAAGLITNAAVGYYAIGAWPVTLVMAAVASLTELFTKELDDNMLIVIFSGAAGHLARMIF